MKGISFSIKRILLFLAYTALGVPIYAYLTFYSIYPVVCMVQISIYTFSGFLYILYSLIVAVGIGIIVEDGQSAFATMILSSLGGYILGYIYTVFPTYLYGYTLYSSDIGTLFFITHTWFLPFFYIIFGLFGVLIGGVIRDYLEEEG